MFKDFSDKIIGFFRSNRRHTTTKALDQIASNLGNMILYKNLIPNLLNEFEIDNKSDKKRSNSFSLKNTKLTLSENTIAHSNNLYLHKIKKNKTNTGYLFGRHYFQRRKGDSRRLTSKSIHRSSYYDIKKSILLGKMDNNNKRKLRRKRTIDPQDTNEANNMEFIINGSEIQFKIKETQEKLEAYQEKMRKTQLRYYVFKKITSYKTTLRKRFQKYRSTVQLMTALDEKQDGIKENNTENNRLKIKLLKNIIKNRAYKEDKELTKFLLRFYYNTKYIAGMQFLQESMKNKDETQNTKNENEVNASKEEMKKEEEKKELTPEELEMLKRKKNKELRDLFNKKVKERQKYLHDRFVRFYYKGLIWAMKTGNVKNNTSSSGQVQPETNNDTNEKPKTEQTNNENNQTNTTSSEIDTLNINKEIEKKDEEQKNEEEPTEGKKAKKKIPPNKLRERSKGLRKLLHERNKEKLNILRKYFFKFLSNGVLLSFKKTTIQSSKNLTDDITEGNGNNGNEEAEKKEEEEKNWITEEKKRRKKEEEKRLKEIWDKRLKLILRIFNKKDKIQCGKERGCLQKWNLRAKIMAIGDLTTEYKKPKKLKGKKKKKKTKGIVKENKEIKAEENENENEEK